MHSLTDAPQALVRPDTAIGTREACGVATQVMLFSMSCFVGTHEVPYTREGVAVLTKMGIPCGVIDIGDTTSKVSLMSPEDYDWLTEGLEAHVVCRGDVV